LVGWKVLEGASVGPSDGVVLGTSVGASDGLSDGLSVGPSDGVVLGTTTTSPFFVFLTVFVGFFVFLTVFVVGFFVSVLPFFASLGGKVVPFPFLRRRSTMVMDPRALKGESARTQRVKTMTAMRAENILIFFLFWF